MDTQRILIKLGGRKHLGEERWRDAIEEYDEIYSICCYKEPSYKWNIPSDKVSTILIPHTFLNQKLFGLLTRTKGRKQLNWLSALAVSGLRICNQSLVKKVRVLNTTNVLCSYGDYDYSDLACLIFGNAIKAPIVRSYKETRPEYNYTEYKAFKRAETIVLYDIELKKFLEKKYGASFFNGKKVLLGYDENALPACVLDKIQYKEKLSTKDHQVHIAILTFRVDSAPGRSRDQGRYYYIDVIKKLMDAGLIVHLHCAQYNDDNGVNRYKELAEQNPGKFFMEKPLEMKHSSTTEEWVESCEILSQYDIGLLHNIVENSTVSEFDRINIPHRFFAYEAAHVLPVIEKGSNVVLERMFAEKRCGFVYSELIDLPIVLNQKFSYYTPSYKDYLRGIFQDDKEGVHDEV